MKKVILLITLLIILMGCQQEPDTQVFVTFDANPSPNTLQEIKSLGLVVDTLSLNQLTGNISSQYINNLRQHPRVIEVSLEPKRQSPPLSSQDVEEYIQEKRIEQGITMGPYIAPEVEQAYKTELFPELCLRFKSGLEVNQYNKFLTEVKEKNPENEFELVTTTATNMSVCAKITKSALDNLREYPWLLQISAKQKIGSPAIGIIDGEQYWIYKDGKKVKIQE